MSHSHAPASDARHQRTLLLALGLTAGFLCVEAIGGLISGSLALLSDAGHMLTDALALGLSLWALRLGARAPDRQRTYGHRRAETVMAFANGLTLVLIAGLIFKEGVLRLLQPVTVAAGQMLLIAGLGLLVNLVVAGLLYKGSAESLNLRGAFLYVLGDLLGSVGAIAAAMVIRYTGWVYADPLVSLLIAGLILHSSLGFLGETWQILLEGTPANADVSRIEACLRQVEGVAGVHDLHVWTLNGDQILLTAHLEVCDETAVLQILATVRALLDRDFGIGHCTLEPEIGRCEGACR